MQSAGKGKLLETQVKLSVFNDKKHHKLSELCGKIAHVNKTWHFYVWDTWVIITQIWYPENLLENLNKTSYTYVHGMYVIGSDSNSHWWSSQFAHPFYVPSITQWFSMHHCNDCRIISQPWRGINSIWLVSEGGWKVVTC